MTARIIVVANQKGGAGKSTVAMQLAGAFARAEGKVLVVDGDPQNTAMRWASSAPDETPFPAAVVNLAHAGKQLHREVRKFLADYDYVIIDCPPSVDSPVPQSALLVADVAIVPVVPSPPDLWAAMGIKALIENAQTINESLRPFLLANMVQGTALGKEVLQLLNDFGLPLLASTLGLRTAYRQSSVYGSTVFELGSQARVAQAEVEALKNEILTVWGQA